MIFLTVWRKKVSNRGNSKYRDPEVGKRAFMATEEKEAQCH